MRGEPKGVNWLFGVIRAAVEKRFTGRLTIDFFKGGIAKVLKQEAVE